MANRHGSVSTYQRHFSQWKLRRYTTQAEATAFESHAVQKGLHALLPSQRTVQRRGNGTATRFYDINRWKKRQTQKQVPNVQRPLPLPNSFAATQLILEQIAVMYECGVVVTSLETSHRHACTAAYEWMLQALREDNRERAAGLCNDILDHFLAAIKASSQNLLPLILYTMINMEAETDQRTKSFLRGFLQLARQITDQLVHPKHPYFAVLRFLTVNHEQSDNCLRGLQMIQELLHKTTSQVMIMEEMETIICDSLRRTKQVERAVIVCQDIVHRRQQLYPPTSAKLLAAMNTLANCHLYLKQPATALEVLEPVTNTLPGATITTLDRFPRGSWYFEACRVSAMARKSISHDSLDVMLHDTIIEVLSPDLETEDLAASLRSIARMRHQCQREAEGLRFQEYITTSLIAANGRYVLKPGLTVDDVAAKALDLLPLDFSVRQHIINSTTSGLLASL